MEYDVTNPPKTRMHTLLPQPCTLTTPLMGGFLWNTYHHLQQPNINQEESTSTTESQNFENPNIVQCVVDLAEVPMLIENSDEETTFDVIDEYNSGHDRSLNSDEESRSETENDFDESDLRSRALRSMLLQASSSAPGNGGGSSKTIKSQPSVQISAATSQSTTTINLYHKSVQNFVVSLSDSSDNESVNSEASNFPTSLSSCRNLPSIVIKSDPSRPQPNVSIGRSTVKQEPTTSTGVISCRNLPSIVIKSDPSGPRPNISLGRSTVKQEATTSTNIISESRPNHLPPLPSALTNAYHQHIYDKHNRAMEQYKQKVKICTAKRQRLTRELNQVRLEHKKLLSSIKSTGRKLEIARRNLKSSELTLKLQRMRTTRIASSKALNAKLTERLKILLKAMVFRILQKVERNSPLSNLNNPPQSASNKKSKLKLANQVIKDSTIPSTSGALVKKEKSCIDPTLPLCPYLLDGQCQDKQCQFQHPITLLQQASTSSNQSFKSKPRYPYLLTVSDPSSRLAINPSQCDLCFSISSPAEQSNSNDTRPNQACQQWHALYAKLLHLNKQQQTTGNKDSRHSLCSSSLVLVKQNPMLTSHHILAFCVSAASHECVANITRLLRTIDFPCDWCKQIAWTPSLPPLVRMFVCRQSIEDLFLIITGVGKSSASKSEPSNNKASDSFICMLYQFCRLAFHSDISIDSLVNYLDEILYQLKTRLSNGSSITLIRYAVWWLKINIQMYNNLPDESTLVSTANVQVLPTATIAKKKLAFTSMISDLDLPSSLSTVETALANSNIHFVASNCCVAIVYYYIRTLEVRHKISRAIDIYLHFCQISTLATNDDLLFGELITLLCKPVKPEEQDDLLSIVQDLVPANVSASLAFSQQMSFVVASRLLQNAKPEQARCALVEALGRIVLVDWPNDFDSVSASYLVAVELSDQLEPRALAYLLANYCLYASTFDTPRLNDFIHLLVNRGVVDQLLQTRCHDFVRPFMTTFVQKAASIYKSDGDTYYRAIQLLLVEALTNSCLDKTALPSWLLECLQLIDFSLIDSSSSKRSDLCFALFNLYGPGILPSLYHALIPCKELNLLTRLFDLASVEHPVDVDFWFFYASLIIRQQSTSNDSNYVKKLIDVFALSVKAVGSSCLLWRFYTKAVAAVGSTSLSESLLASAKFYLMDKVVKRVLDNQSDDDLRSILEPPTADELTCNPNAIASERPGCFNSNSPSFLWRFNDVGRPTVCLSSSSAART